MSKVYLIGAGPGDPGLLTIRAKEIIETADVIVYDYLANARFLRYAREDAEIIYVGKKGGDHTLPQDQINRLLVDKAREGRSVARLKGGDPYMFGRGGEEAEELLADGISFEVIPGVTSAIAGPAYAGIPLTHRSYASSVSFITGHEDPTKAESAHNWQALADAANTLVFFMGMKNLPDIASRLIAHGRAKETPVALVRWGTTCRHRSHVGTLESIAEDAVRLGFSSPSLIVVGEVCALHDTLNWYERKPLLGFGVVVTRAREQASELLDLLEEMGACCFEFPTIAIDPLEDDEPIAREVTRLHEYDWVVFTSVNGVKWFWKTLSRLGRDARTFAGLHVAAIGPATADALRQRGIEPDFVPDRYVAEEVVEGMRRRGVDGKRILVPRALVAREVLPEELREAGAEVTVLPVYVTRLAEENGDAILEALEGGEVHYVTFTSSSTVENFFSLVSPKSLRPFLARGLRLACIGPVTANTLERFGFSTDIMPEAYTIPGLAQAVAQAGERGA